MTSEQKQRFVQAFRMQAHGAEMMIKAGKQAVLLMEKCAEELASLSNEVDEAPITHAAIVTQAAAGSAKAYIEQWKLLMEEANVLANEGEATP